MPTFTTYINAKRSGSVDSEFAAIEASADKSLSGIQRKAEAASRALAGLSGGRGSGGIRSPIGPEFGASMDVAAAKAAKLAAEEARLARENSTLVRGLRTTGQTLQVVQGPLGPIAGRVTAAADALARMSGITLGLGAAGAALFAYTRAANQFVEIRSKLAPLYASQVQVNQAMSDVYGIAQRARAGLAPVVDLYSKLTQAANQFGWSQQRAARLTELASKAATISGGSAQSREAGLYQFSQGISSNTLAGDELKSVGENISFLRNEIAKGLGKLPEFKGVDTSIGNLKNLASQGKLTADVVDRALNAVADDIEQRFAKLPPTLGTAFTSLQNSATMFVGRFEEATGVVGTLASGIMLLGNNLNQIVGILGGVAAGWLAVSAASKASDISKYVRTQIDAARMQQSQARVNLALAVDARNETIAQTVAMTQQANQIRQNIAALEAELVVQQELARQGAIAARAGLPGGSQQAAAGAAGAARVTRELSDEIEHLGVVQVQAASAGRRLEGQHKAVDVATRNVTKTSSLFKMGLTNLLGAINPVGIAVGLATTAFLEWAMAESEAEKNAKKVEDAQRQLATVIDFTTGKITEQNAVLLANAKLNAGQSFNAAQQNYRMAREAVGQIGSDIQARTYSGLSIDKVTSPSERQMMQAIGRFSAGGSIGDLQKTMEELAKQDPAMKHFADEVARLGPAVVNSAKDVEQMRAALRVMNGEATPENVRRLNRDFSGGRAIGEGANRNLDAEAAALAEKLKNARYAAEVQEREAFENLEKRKSTMQADDYVRERAQIINTYNLAIANLDKQDSAAADRAKREEERRERAHQAELKRIQEENDRRQARTEKRQNILGSWTDEPKAVIKAQRDVQTLNDLVGKTMNGLEAITKDNPLGQGIYTKEMAAADAANIEEGLQRPYNQYMQERQRDLNVSKLLLQGRELEAQALQQAYTLYDQVGKVTMDQYESILSNLRIEERINDALASRQRLLAPLQEGVGQLRDSIASALEEFESGGNPLKAGRNVLKGIFSQFNKITATQLAERITGGLDARVRDLMTGSVQVDTKIAEYISALNDQQNAGETMAEALNSAATAANNAATALNSIPSQGGAAGALGEAGASIIGPSSASLMSLFGGGATIPSSFYKQGTSIGSGIGDDVLWKALGPLGAVITENLRPQSRQNSYFAAGLTTARVSDHTTSQDAWDVRLPAGMSFQRATALVEKTARSMGAEVVKALDETMSGGTGRHAHYVIRGDGAAADSPDAVAAATGNAAIGSTPQQVAVEAIKTVSDVANKINASGGSGYVGLDGLGYGGGGAVADNGVVVTGQRLPMASSGVPNAEQYYNKIGQAFGSKLDKTFGTHFLGDLGSKLGTALSGAQTGAMVAGVGKMIWSKFSTTGAEIGGAIGKFIPIPGGDIIGSIIGGTIGGLLKKTKSASVTLTGNNGEVQVGDARGSGSKEKAASSAAGSSVGDALNQIADALGGTIGNFAVSIGMKKGRYVVDTTGQGRTGYGKPNDGITAYSTEEEAVQAALADAIADGAIKGISAASQRILKSGKDLQTALNKAIAIESIPKALKAIKDPVGAAIDDLNAQFSKLISYLKEGGATAEQYAQAQELYDLQRQQAIEQATNQATSSIQDMIDSMTSSSQSPLNKRTVYENAQAKLQTFVTDVQSGKTVDNDAFLKAVSDMQDASRALNGSNSSFFSDFNYLLGLLNQEKSNITAGETPTGQLPPSPFDDPAVQKIINGTQGTTDAINYQTTVLADRLDRLLAARVAGGYSPSAIDYLAGLRVTA